MIACQFSGENSMWSRSRPSRRRFSSCMCKLCARRDRHRQRQASSISMLIEPIPRRGVPHSSLEHQTLMLGATLALSGPPDVRARKPLLANEPAIVVANAPATPGIYPRPAVASTTHPTSG